MESRQNLTPRELRKRQLEDRIDLLDPNSYSARKAQDQLDEILEEERIEFEKQTRRLDDNPM